MLHTSEQNNNDHRKFYYENNASKKTMKQHLQTPERRTKILLNKANLKNIGKTNNCLGIQKQFITSGTELQQVL